MVSEEVYFTLQGRGTSSVYEVSLHNIPHFLVPFISEDPYTAYETLQYIP